MESPSKKRKIASQESQASKVTSTPQRDIQTSREVSPAISRIGEESSSSSRSAQEDAPFTRKRFDSSAEKPDSNAVSSDRSNLGDVLERNSSLADETGAEEEEDVLDYDDFFSKLTRFQKKGHVWNLFKPIGEDEGSLYHLILDTPREAGVTAGWFVGYCKNTNIQGATYLMYKFCLDCSGYQTTNVKRYFTEPLPPVADLVNAVVNKVDNERCSAEVFTTGKFLFAAKSPLAKVLQMAVYNFLQKFVLEAHQQDLLYGELFIRLVKFLQVLSKASYIQLIYTGVIFMIKLLTGICMVKANTPETSLGSKQVLMLDNFINTLYMNSVKACLQADSGCSSLQLACITELQIWVHYSATVFIDHYDCVSVLAKLTLEEVKTVRLAALEAFLTMVQNERLVPYLQAGPIENLAEHVTGRFYDVDVTVALKAVEVYTALCTHHLNVVKKRKKIFEVLVQMIYHKDYRMGAAACKCVIQLLQQENQDEKTLLLQLCKLATNFYPTLKPLLVESCMGTTNVLQNWSLIVELFASPHCQDVSDEIQETLSELFVESVHQVLTGASSKIRQFSRALVCDLTQHKLIADEIYPNLKAILVLFRRKPHIARKILSIVIKIKPEYLGDEHIEPMEQFLQFLMKFFVYWTDMGTLASLLDVLVFVQDHVPRLSSSFRNTNQDLKKYVSGELYKSFKTRDNRTMVMAQKTSLVFSRFDLNDNVEWSKLLMSWDIIESNVEYLGDMTQCCYWSLVWKVRRLSSAQLSKAEQNQELSSLANMSRAFFSNCSELLAHEDRNIKFKAFERICESYIGFCQELENISKQIRALEDLKPCLKEEATQKQLTDVFELSVGTCEGLQARKYAMYIANMALLKILPMDSISIIWKYYDKYYDTYGKEIESVMSAILEKDDNWVPMLLINAVCMCFERFLAKHGVVDVRSQEARDILSLSRKFADCKTIKDPKIASKLLFYAVNYAVQATAYEFLIFVRVFINQIQDYPDTRKEILEHLKKKVPKSDMKSDPVMYFVEHLVNGESKKTGASKAPIKRGRPPKVPKAPKLKIQSTKVKKVPQEKNKVMPRQGSQTTESDEGSDDLTIHDTSSDDLEDNLSNLSIAK